MPNITWTNQGQSIMLQGFKGIYFAPKQELDLKERFPKYQEMNLALVKKDFVDNFRDRRNRLTMYEDVGIVFYFRDGSSSKG